MSTTTDVISDVVTKVPPLSIVGGSLLGLDVQQWVYVATLVWLTLQVGHFVFTKIGRPLYVKGKRASRKRR